MNVSIANLKEAIQAILEVAAKPVSEYQLIVQLREQGWDLPTDAVDTLALFKSHFLIYHALYHLQSDYWEARQYWLEISALAIALHPMPDFSSSTALHCYQQDHKLRAYYLDLSNLESETVDSISELLNQFWQVYINTDERSKALAVFQMDETVSYDDIKRRYRQLAMEKHPDRGGDGQQFQQINWAFGVLQQAYKPQQIKQD